MTACRVASANAVSDTKIHLRPPRAQSKLPRDFTSMTNLAGYQILTDYPASRRLRLRQGFSHRVLIPGNCLK